MATTPVIKKSLGGTPGAALYKWSGLAGGDVGAIVRAPLATDKSVHVSDVTDTGTISIEGSLDPDDATAVFTQLSDTVGDALALTAVGLSAILENTLAIRPNVTSFTACDVWLLVSC